MKKEQPPINNSGQLNWYAVAFTDPNYRDFAIIAPSEKHAQALASRLVGVKVEQRTVQPVMVRPRKLLKHA